MAKRKRLDFQQRMRLYVEAHELAREADALEQAGKNAKALAKRKRSLKLFEKAEADQSPST